MKVLKVCLQATRLVVMLNQKLPQAQVVYRVLAEPVLALGKHLLFMTIIYSDISSPSLCVTFRDLLVCWSFFSVSLVFELFSGTLAAPFFSLSQFFLDPSLGIYLTTLYPIVFALSCPYGKAD